MKFLCVLIVLAALASLATPAMVSAGEAPATPPAAVSVAPAPPTAANLLDAIFSNEGGPCIYICAISRDCGCDPPVSVECAGCRSCNQSSFGVVCDGVVTSCPPSAW
jgi:hypothetical protein